MKSKINKKGRTKNTLKKILSCNAKKKEGCSQRYFFRGPLFIIIKIKYYN